MKNSVWFGAILCFIAAASWGAMFPVAHSAFKHIDPFYFTIIRYVSVTVILVAILFWKEGKQAFRFEGKGKQLWFYGTMAFTVYNLLIFWGEDLLGEPGIMVASVMEALMPMISIVIASILYKRFPQPITLIFVIIAFVGAILVITKGNIQSFLGATTDMIPSLLILIAVIGWVVYTMGGPQFAGWSALRYSTLTCLLGTLTAVIIVAALTIIGFISVPSIETVIVTAPHSLFMIIFPGVIALLGWNVGVNILSPLNALLFINFVPITTLTISIIQGSSITIFDYLGTIFIIVSLVGNNIYLRMSERKDSKQENARLVERPSS
ncbi:DMT family transporter [Oceanobacillus luteolus]|uniref:DMT family transporter n=1 Tax=Oceanobacillus luteolus TaxID=1274358 RepID=A0ABW4HXA7_9BACI|nr:DMT family transporter [Oceanobacillus luteolus]MCM3740897.1 DMT family transporter [Oceanobacillus luteolus]